MDRRRHPGCGQAGADPGAVQAHVPALKGKGLGSISGEKGGSNDTLDTAAGLGAESGVPLPACRRRASRSRPLASLACCPAREDRACN